VQVAQEEFHITEVWELLLLAGQQMVAMERQATIQLGFTKLVAVVEVGDHTQLVMVAQAAQEGWLLVEVEVEHPKTETLVRVAWVETDL
jgi:putative Ca2+/H+ antiporter (TMEM165/GDT1 family)